MNFLAMVSICELADADAGTFYQGGWCIQELTFDFSHYKVLKPCVR